MTDPAIGASTCAMKQANNKFRQEQMFLRNDHIAKNSTSSTSSRLLEVQ